MCVCACACQRARLCVSVEGAYSPPPPPPQEEVFSTHVLITDSYSRVYVKPRDTFVPVFRIPPSEERLLTSLTNTSLPSKLEVQLSWGWSLLGEKEILFR